MVSLFKVSAAIRLASVRFMSDGSWGSGAGKGGGSGGSISKSVIWGTPFHQPVFLLDAGGGLGKLETANEELYFRKLQALQLKRLREHLEEQVDNHAKAIREHEERIKYHEKKLKQLKEHEDDMNKKH